jgi:hypothetical protein
LHWYAGDNMTRFLEKYPFHLFLVAVYPVIFLLAENIESVRMGAGLRASLLLLTVALLAFLLSLLLTRDLRKSGITALVMVLVFFLFFFLLYAPAYRWLREVSLAGHVLGRHRYLVPFTGLVVLTLGLMTWRLSRKASPRFLKNFTLAANLVSLALILIPVITIIAYSLKKQTASGLTRQELPVLDQALKLPDQPPDVYYIILDMHTSDQVLKELMAYDNSAFTTALRERGFFVSTCSRSNYASTQLSLTSSVNMAYLQDFTDSYKTSSLYPYFQSSRVRLAFENAGYLIYAFESGYPYTDLVDADHYFQPVTSTLDLLRYPGLTPFESLLMRVSAGQILYETREGLSQQLQYIIDAAYVEYRDRILYTLDTLPQLAKEPGPKFVFAHILAPHDPFVFDADGSTAWRRTPFALNEDPEFAAGYGWDVYGPAYVDEIIYVHQRVLAIIDQIMTTSATPPVIILQGDHGIPRLVVSDAQYEIYNAIYLGGETTALYNNLSPVNNFRLVFNQVFGTQMELLEDLSYQFDPETETFIPFTSGLTCP